MHTATYTIKFNQSREICLFGQNRSTYPVQGSRFIRSWKSRMFPNLIQTRQGYEKRKTINNRGGKKGKKRRWIILNKIYKVYEKREERKMTLLRDEEVYRVDRHKGGFSIKISLERTDCCSPPWMARRSRGREREKEKEGDREGGAKRLAERGESVD